MLRTQLQNLKESRKAVHSQMKGRVVFGDTADMDDETILELVPIKTAYTTRNSLLFDRQRLNEMEEEDFNVRFSKFLMGLVEYGNVKDIEYLFDYLVRRYLCDRFNQREMMFALLPFKKYYKEVLVLSRTSEFNYFCMQPTYSTKFVANLCLRDKCFFDFFVGYFEHFGAVRGFCTEVLGYVVEGLKNSNEDFSMQLFTIMSKILAAGEHSEAEKLFFGVRSYVAEVVEEFVEILQPVFGREYLLGKKEEDLGKLHPSSLTNENEFKEIYERMEERKLLKEDGVSGYVAWLIRKGYTPKSFTENEFDALKILYGTGNRELNGEMGDYIRLFVEMKERRELLRLLCMNFKEDASVLIPHMSIAEKILVAGIVPELFELLVCEENCSVVVKALPREFLNERLFEVLKRCIRYVNFDCKSILGCGKRVEEMLNELLEDGMSSDIIAGNVIAIARIIGMNIAELIVERELYRNPVYLEYISKSDESFGEDVGRKILSVAKSMGNVGRSLLCEYFYNRHGGELMNDALQWVVDEGRCCSILLPLLRRRLYELSVENCERMLRLWKWNEEAYFLLERLYELRKDVVDECLCDGYYGAVVHLCKKNGFTHVLGSRCVTEVEEIVRTASRTRMSERERVEFVSYACSIVSSCKNAVSVLLESRYILDLMKCRESREWRLVKILIQESLKQCGKRAQECFDYFIENYGLFIDDLDLLESIVECGVVFDVEKLSSVLYGTSGALRARFVEILLEKDETIDLLRFVPLIIADMIEQKSTVLGGMFERYGNIMGPYVGEVLMRFPEMREEMLDLEPKYLITGAIKAYTNTLEASNFDFVREVLNVKKLIPAPLLEKLSLFLMKMMDTVSDELLISFFECYLRICEDIPEGCTGGKLLEFVYENRMMTFFGIAEIGIPICSSAFRKYLGRILEMVEMNGEKKAVAFVTEYLYQDSECDVSHTRLFRKLFRFYCNDADVVYAKCMGSVLRHNPEAIEMANDMILDRMSGEKIVVMLELLQILYQKVYEFKRCLKKSSPHFALVADSSRKDISSAVRKLFGVIEKKHGKSGHQLVHGQGE